eukprot:SM003820S14563  [mRNA]  locus=s3820:677:964:+ [translate_table: standard]
MIPCPPAHPPARPPAHLQSHPERGAKYCGEELSGTLTTQSEAPSHSSLLSLDLVRANLLQSVSLRRSQIDSSVIVHPGLTSQSCILTHHFVSRLR